VGWLLGLGLYLRRIGRACGLPPMPMGTSSDEHVSVRGAEPYVDAVPAEKVRVHCTM
jgi:hypothetical protein